MPSAALACAACGCRIEGRHAAPDLTTRSCPSCGVSCLLFNFEGALVQIILDRTPPAHRATLESLKNWPNDSSVLETITSFAELFHAVESFGSGPLPKVGSA
jgi:hypothetical protein